MTSRKPGRARIERTLWRAAGQPGSRRMVLKGAIGVGAATVNSASRWNRFVQITLPLVQPCLVAIVLARAIDAFKVFDTIDIVGVAAPGPPPRC
jgi:hypothetical protein